MLETMKILLLIRRFSLIFDSNYVVKWIGLQTRVDLSMVKIIKVKVGVHS